MAQIDSAHKCASQFSQALECNKVTVPPPWSHTNRELELMLQKKKPLAVFSEDVSFLPDEEIIPELGFALHVENGSIVREEFVLPGLYSPVLERDTVIKHVFFALKGEEWRINAMYLLHRQLERTAQWNETCGRIEGSLLGYSDEENDAWCKDKYDKPAL